MSPAVPQPWSVYVHIPWCRTRCPYCPFTVVVDRGWDKAAYTRALRQQWEALRGHFTGAPSTLFFGGGTPSLHPPEQLAELVAVLGATDEVSLEANPGQVDAHTLGVWRRAGVTRLSLGVQTFTPRHARLLNRGHTVGESRALLDQVRRAGWPTWSVDLIFALPDQTQAELDADLDALFAAGAPHVSLYGLTAEEDTPLGRAVERGRLSLPDGDRWRELMDRVVERLGAEGYERYEVSNFARPGHRCLHNTRVWQGAPYAGLGVAAHGYLPDGQRTIGPTDVHAFVADPHSGSVERPTPRQAAIDHLLGAMRHVEGLAQPDLARWGQRLDPVALDALAAAGLLLRDGERVRLGEAGWPVADAVIARLAQTLLGLDRALPLREDPSVPPRAQRRVGSPSAAAPGHSQEGTG